MPDYTLLHKPVFQKRGADSFGGTSHAQDGIFGVKPRFHNASVMWNLDLTWKIATTVHSFHSNGTLFPQAWWVQADEHLVYMWKRWSWSSVFALLLGANRHTLLTAVIQISSPTFVNASPHYIIAPFFAFFCQHCQNWSNLWHGMPSEFCFQMCAAINFQYNKMPQSMLNDLANCWYWLHIHVQALITLADDAHAASLFISDCDKLQYSTNLKHQNTWMTSDQVLHLLTVTHF